MAPEPLQRLLFETSSGQAKRVPSRWVLYAGGFRAEYEANVEYVLTDLESAFEKYVSDRSDIYHPEVAVELKHSVVVCGRHYKVGRLGHVCVISDRAILMSWRTATSSILGLADAGLARDCRRLAPEGQ